MKGTRILASSPPRGHFEQVIVVGTPKPGVVMELADIAPVGNIYSYSVYGTKTASGGNYVTNDGDRKAIAILVEQDDINAIYSRAYVTGDRGYIYWPVLGEWFNMLLQNQSGTADSFSITSELMVDDGTGKLLAADSNAEAHPFTCLETVSALTADALALCRFNGCGGA